MTPDNTQAQNSNPAAEATDAQENATAESPESQDDEIGTPRKPFMRTIKSFVKRAGRTTGGQAKAFEELGPRFLIPYSKSAIDLVAAYANSTGDTATFDPRTSPIVLEIGFGMGEATAKIAQVLPDTTVVL